MFSPLSLSSFFLLILFLSGDAVELDFVISLFKLWANVSKVTQYVPRRKSMHELVALLVSWTIVCLFFHSLVSFRTKGFYYVTTRSRKSILFRRRVVGRLGKRHECRFLTRPGYLVINHYHVSVGCGHGFVALGRLMRWCPLDVHHLQVRFTDGHVVVMAKGSVMGFFNSLFFQIIPNFLGPFQALLHHLSIGFWQARSKICQVMVRSLCLNLSYSTL